MEDDDNNDSQRLGPGEDDKVCPMVSQTIISPVDNVSLSLISPTLLSNTTTCSFDGFVYPTLIGTNKD